MKQAIMKRASMRPASMRRIVARLIPSTARVRRAVAVLVVVTIVALGALFFLRREPARGGTIRVVAAGDMACDPDDPNFLANSEAEGDHCRQEAVSSLAVVLNPEFLLGLGDYQYELPTADAYRDVYQPTWGRLHSRTIPVFGNQEYKVDQAGTFTAYFGDRVRDTLGYWSQDIGNWHLVVLNSNCAAVDGGCTNGSAQQQWLAADLAANDRECVIAAWHHPRWSTGIAGPDERTRDLYRTLYDHKVELVLSGHEADYERFEPLDPDGRADSAGVRQFVVGTGGQAHYRPDALEQPVDGDGDERAPAGRPRSEFVDYDHHGVLELQLGSGHWVWRFHALDAGVVDEGEAACF